MSNAFMVLAIAGLVSCSPQQTKREIYSVLYDTTDPLLAMPEAQSLWGYMDGDDTSKDLVLRYSQLSDVEMNRVHQWERPAIQSGLFSNAVQEKKRQDESSKEFEELIETKDSIGASHSAIFKPILAELEYLASLPKGDHKQLIVYSNLRENTDWLSFYRSQDLWLLENQTESVIERFLDQVPKNADYTDVELTIVFIPIDFKENREFKMLREVYISVFKKLDVPITFSGNLVRPDSKP